MNRPRWGWAVALGLSLLAPSVGRAQVAGQGLGNDPFSLYYGWYLPNQAYQAAQPRPEDTINANVLSRQYGALRDRGELFEPYSPFGGPDEGSDVFAPYAPRRGERGPRPVAVHQGNMRGIGPVDYYQRHARYFPALRRGIGPNRNIAVMRRGAGGIPSMPSMPSVPGGR